MGHSWPVEVQEFDPDLPQRRDLLHLCLRPFEYSLSYLESQTLDNIEMWINLFYENKSEKSIMILCGSKSDLEKY